MRTITELYSLKGRVYLWFGSIAAHNHFRKLAEEEGFHLPGGDDDILALHPAFEFWRTGWVGHMLFHNPKSCKREKLIRVDYTKWITGADDYLYHSDGK